MTAWTVLALLVTVALLGFTLLDTGASGNLGLAFDSDRVYPPLDRVRYSLAALTYLHGDQVLTGPHRALPLALGWLTLHTLLMWLAWKRWAVTRARRALHVGGLALALTVVGGGAILEVAQAQHNRLLASPTIGLDTPVHWVQASPLALAAWSCGRWDTNGDHPGCQDRWTSTFPNPTLWALVGTFASLVAGLIGPRSREHTAPT